MVNALSSRLTVEIHRDGHRWTQEYEKGTPITPLTRNEETSEHGTAIAFLPDADIFDTTRYSFATLWSTSGTCLPQRGPGRLTHRRASGAAVRYHHADGLRDSLAHLNTYAPSLVHSPPSASSWRTKTRRSSYRSPCNGTPGPRESSAPSRTAPEPMRAAPTNRASRTALTDLVNHYARRQRQISADGEDITAEAIREGLTRSSP